MTFDARRKHMERRKFGPDAELERLTAPVVPPVPPAPKPPAPKAK